MHFGLRLLQHLGPARELIRLAQVAEQAGFDSVWFPHDPFLKHAPTLAVATAAATKRIGVGAIQTTPYTNDPSEIAAYAATLDELSGGRALLGIGLHTGDMVEWVGYDSSDRVERTRETIALVRRLLRGEIAASDGVFRWNEQCYLRFEPLRREIPIYVTAFGRDLLELSGAIGDGSFPMLTPPESAPLMIEPIHEGARRAGRDPADVEVAGCVWLSVSEDGAVAADALRPIVAYFAPYFPDEQLAAAGLSRDDLRPVKQLVDEARYDEAAAAVSDDMLRLALAGTPDAIVERIAALADAGVTHVNLGGPLGPDPEAAIRLVGERVIPALA